MRCLPALVFAGVSLFAADRFLRDDSLVKSVERQVRDNLPTREERRFDEIGWAPNLLAAEAAAKQANRPVYLFTYDGNIDTGRC